MKCKKDLKINYRFIDYEQLECQKRLDDAFDVLLYEIEIEDLERINNKNDYEQHRI